MKAFLGTKVGVISVSAFVVVMGFMLHRVLTKDRKSHRVAAAATTPSVVAPPATVVTQTVAPNAASMTKTQPDPDLIENAAYLDRLKDLESRTHETQDRQGNPVTQRANARTPTGFTQTQDDESPTTASSAATSHRASHRLQGKQAASRSTAAASVPLESNPEQPIVSRLRSAIGVAPETALSTRLETREPQAKRFNPYGRVIKCELVFTIDSTNEQTPLIGVVTEPVYNNGELVIPAGAEIHGTARPDRLRDRIFSGTDWVLVFPREGGRPNGRQLTVHGVALDRVEPDANGMTWGITDGSYGLEGAVIRTSREEEIKRFAATFFSQAAETLQERESDRGGRQSVRNTPQNAMLQGLAANLEKLAQDISTEIAQHGVFIRVPAGHQFYLYPMQTIDPEAAELPSTLATIK